MKYELTDTIKNKIFAPIRNFIRTYSFWFIAVVALVFLAFIFEAGRYSVYFMHPELTSAEQANKVLKKVGELIQLPVGETPTMATINDAASAKKAQPFLANSENGDILIIYPNAQEAIVYQPSTNKLIVVGPVNNNTVSKQVSAPVSAPITASSTNDATTTKAKR
jgi:hypothetical protein